MKSNISDTVYDLFDIAARIPHIVSSIFYTTS